MDKLWMPIGLHFGMTLRRWTAKCAQLAGTSFGGSMGSKPGQFGIREELAAQAAVRKALKRIGKSQNVAEIISVDHRSLCGLNFCRVQLVAHHVQKEMILRIAPSVGLISPAARPETGLALKSNRRRLLARSERYSGGTQVYP
jgi:hypothetical protein